MQRRIVPHIMLEQTLTTIEAGVSVAEAARLMANRRIGALPVIAGARLSGIVTERDVLFKVVAEGRDPAATAVSDIMTADPDTVTPDSLASDALERMHSGGYRHLPVLDGDRLIGIVSIRDLYAAIKVELEEGIQEREAFIAGSGYGAG